MAKFGEQLFDEGIDALHTATAIGLGVHLWAGLAVSVIAVLRFRRRIVNPPTSPEANEPSRWMSWADPAARLTHYVLYVLLVAVPTVGILLLLTEGKVLSVFGLADIAPYFKVTRGIARNLLRLHVVLANVLVIVAIFHATTAILHQMKFSDGTLGRMVPRPRKDNSKTP
jgi:cytochrome b561